MVLHRRYTAIVGDSDTTSVQSTDMNPTTQSKSLAKLPPEVLQCIFRFCRTPFGGALRAVRLTCKHWSELAIPILFRRISVYAHLYYLERLAHDMKKSPALRSTRVLALKTHGTANIAMMFDYAFRRHGLIVGLIEERYVQLERSEYLHMLEVQVLSTIMGLLDRLDEVDMDLKDNPSNYNSDYWDRSKCLANLEQKLDISDYAEWEYIPHRNWHYRNPTVADSIMRAVDGFPSIQATCITRLDVSRIVELDHQASRYSVGLLRKLITKLDRIWLGLTFFGVDWTKDENSRSILDDRWRTIQVGRTALLGDLIRSAVNCTELRLIFDEKTAARSVGSCLQWCNGKLQSPALPKLKTVHLAGLRCTPYELFVFLTFHCPSLEHLGLLKVEFISSATAKERSQWWIILLKKLKAKSNLKTFKFGALFNVTRDLPNPTGTAGFETAYFDFQGPPPVLYHKTIEWFMDKSTGDAECPLNNCEPDDTIGSSDLEGYGLSIKNYPRFKM